MRRKRKYESIKNKGRLITKTEAAKRLGVSRPYFYRLIERKGLPVTVSGRIDTEQLEEWLRSGGREAPPKKKAS